MALINTVVLKSFSAKTFHLRYSSSDSTYIQLIYKSICLIYLFCVSTQLYAVHWLHYWSTNVKRIWIRKCYTLPLYTAYFFSMFRRLCLGHHRVLIYWSCLPMRICVLICNRVDLEFESQSRQQDYKFTWFLHLIRQFLE